MTMTIKLSALRFVGRTEALSLEEVASNPTLAVTTGFGRIVLPGCRVDRTVHKGRPALVLTGQSGIAGYPFGAPPTNPQPLRLKVVNGDRQPELLPVAVVRW